MTPSEQTDSLGPARISAPGRPISLAYRALVAWWGAWQEQSTGRRLLAAMVTVGGLTACVRLVMGVKELVVAYEFGTTMHLDAYLIALVLPQFAITLVAGSFNVAMMPTYIQVREQQGRAAAQELLSAVMGWALLLLTATTLLMAAGAPAAVRLLGAAPGVNGSMLLATTLYYGLLPVIILSGLSTIWGALLNAHHRFALAAIVPIFTPLFTMALVFSLARQWDVYVLVLALVMGTLLEVLWLGWALRREGLSLTPRWLPQLSTSRQVWGQFQPAVAAAFLMGCTAVVTQSTAAHLGPSNVSAYSYGTKLTHLIVGVGAVAVGTAVLPHFSRLVAMEDWVGLRRIWIKVSFLIAAVTIPLALCVAFWSTPLVALLFERGAFTAADSDVVGRVQAMFVLQGPPYIMSLLAVRLLSALKANRFMLWGNMLNLAACLLFNYLFAAQWGVAGVALAISAMYGVSFLFAATVCWHLLARQQASRLAAAGPPFLSAS